jgi:hypothetical protein
MPHPGLRLSRPLYESLPWFYVVAGILALAASYRHEGRSPLITFVGIIGLLAVLAGIVILLRRRDYRALRASYSDPDSILALRDDR